MRQMISGLVAAAAVMFVGAAPATACGFNPCQPVAPVFSGCNTGCGGYGYGYGASYGYGYGGGYERLAEPTTQYYYVNQGPTYTGPGAFAPYPTYQEDAVVAPANYGYGYGYRAAAVAPPAAIPIAARTTVRIATATARATATCRARITATVRAMATPIATRRITAAIACCAAITDL